jgi:hypothetical protein
VKCHLCEELSSELYKAQQEILSYRKVIQVLREEFLNTDQHARSFNNTRSELFNDQSRSSKPKDGWYQVPFSSRKAKPTKNSSFQTIPHTHNKFELLSYLKEDSDLPSRTVQTKPGTIIVKNVRKPKHNVLLIGDSHARAFVPRLQLNLGKAYSVSSYVKPGAPMKVISSTANEEKKTLKGKYVLVIWGGANNISNNNASEAISVLSD